MSKAMSFNEFGQLLKHIAEHHSPFSHTDHNTRMIKYVDPHFDMRSNTVFSIKFRTYGGEYDFHVMNECRELEQSLYERCMAFLKEPRYTPLPHVDNKPKVGEITAA